MCDTCKEFVDFRSSTFLQKKIQQSSYIYRQTWTMVYIVGIGTHSDVIKGILPASQETSVISIEDFMKQLSTFQPEDKFICALGDNAKRMEVVQKSYPTIQPTQWINAVHISAVIADNIQLGRGNVICAGAVVQTQAQIGNHCIINTHASIDHHCKISDFVHVAPNVAVCGSVQIGEGSFVATSSSVMPKLILAPWSFIKAGTLVKHSTGPIAMYQPYIKDSFTNDIKMVADAGALTSATPYHSFVKKSEELLCKTLGCKYAILMNNGTSSTHCLFLALKHKYPHIGKIYVPNHVYVAVWNTALYEYNPDQLEVLPVDSRTLNMPEDETFLHTLQPHSALVVVHNVGNVIHIPRIQALRPDLVIVEDNCEGLFGKHGTSFTGTKSFCSSVSFFANKTITCGEGGAFMTNDEDTYKYIRKVHSQGMTSERYVHDVLGYNYRITNIQAAFLYPQIVEYKSIIEKKRALFALYKSLINHPNVKWIESQPDTESSSWMMILRIRNSNYRDMFAFFEKRYIETRPFFYDIHRHKHLQSIPVPEGTRSPLLNPDELVMLPSYPTLEIPQVAYLSRMVNEYAQSLM